MDGSDFANGRGDLPAWAWVRDPVFGRTVTVPNRALATIARDHAPIAYLPRRDLLRALAGAERHVPDAERQLRHLYYDGGVGHSRGLCAVVEYGFRGAGEAFTASPSRRIPG